MTRISTFDNAADLNARDNGQDLPMPEHFDLSSQGFETDDGGQGTLTLDVPSGRLSIHHQENYTATNESSREWHV